MGKRNGKSDASCRAVKEKFWGVFLGLSLLATEVPTLQDLSWCRKLTRQHGNVAALAQWPCCWYWLLIVVVKVRIQIGLSFFDQLTELSALWSHVAFYIRLSQLWEQCEQVKLKSVLQGWNPAKGLPGGEALGILSETCTFCWPLETLNGIKGS